MQIVPELWKRPVRWPRPYRHLVIEVIDKGPGRVLLSPVVMLDALLAEGENVLVLRIRHLVEPPTPIRPYKHPLFP